MYMLIFLEVICASLIIIHMIRKMLYLASTHQRQRFQIKGQLSVNLSKGIKCSARFAKFLSDKSQEGMFFFFFFFSKQSV